MTKEIRRLNDAASLRALAHPLRQELYERLVLEGALTASELADRVGESPSNCSWHLRKLAQHGLVEEAGGGHGRQRPWRATASGLSWQDDDEPDEDRAGAALTRMVLDRERTRLDHSLERLRSDDRTWRDAASVTQALLWLTDEELGEITQAFSNLAMKYAGRLEDPDARPPGSRLCSYLAWGVPTYDVLPETPGDVAEAPSAEASS